MKVVFVYGPPATGKLTVARELCRLTGLRLFHNHLTVDLAGSLFPHGSPEYFDYVQHLRREAFGRATAAGVDLAFTFWYSRESRPSVAAYRRVIESGGGEVFFVRLWCRPEVLEGRVADPSRQGWKIASVPDLRAALEAYPDSFETIPGTALEIDTSDLLPDVVARQIALHFGLEAAG
ncbi:AAA family ATPase [Deinococcus altitudinis]|uniref:AAA family ATPase n=1 Tax=Deinococcus altitudinis TaxID=468914 RepID=UPI00389233B9